MKTRGEYIALQGQCAHALALTPKWSPYRLFWKFGIWYAKRKINELQR